MKRTPKFRVKRSPSKSRSRSRLGSRSLSGSRSISNLQNNCDGYQAIIDELQNTITNLDNENQDFKNIINQLEQVIENDISNQNNASSEMMINEHKKVKTYYEKLKLDLAKSNFVYLDIDNKTGHEIMMGDENRDVKEFIEETFKDEEIPLIFRIQEVNGSETIYLVDMDSFNKTVLGDNIPDTNRPRELVYPCWQKNNWEFVTQPGQPAYPGTGPAGEIPQDAIQNGVVIGSPNVRDIPLISLQKIFNRRIYISYSDFSIITSDPRAGPPYFFNVYKSDITVPTVAQLPFQAGVGDLHCNIGAEPEQIWHITSMFTNYIEPEVPLVGGKLRKRISKKRISKKRKLNKSKKQRK